MSKASLIMAALVGSIWFCSAILLFAKGFACTGVTCLAMATLFVFIVIDP